MQSNTDEASEALTSVFVVSLWRSFMRVAEIRLRRGLQKNEQEKSVHVSQFLYHGRSDHVSSGTVSSLLYNGARKHNRECEVVHQQFASNLKLWS